MENIRRSIKVFFAVYGKLLFGFIGLILIIIFGLRGVDNMYKDSIQIKEENKIANTIDKQEVKKEETENILYISKFLDYCNENNINKAYEMLSDKCIQNKYQNIDIFKSQYIDKIFTYKKDYEVKKEEELYKVIILEGILESGKIDNRDSTINYFIIDKDKGNIYITIER